MSTETFNTNYLFAKATVTIDAETGNIIKVVHEGTNMEIDIPPDNFKRFEEDTAETRRAIVAECRAEGLEYEKHIQRESAYVRSI